MHLKRQSEGGEWGSNACDGAEERVVGCFLGKSMLYGQCLCGHKHNARSTTLWQLQDVRLYAGLFVQYAMLGTSDFIIGGG